MWCRWLLMGESWVIMTQKCSPLITSFDRLPALPTTSKHILYKGKKVNTDVASEDLDDDSLAERALRGVLWFRFKINKFSLCELVQQNLKSWLETLTQRRVFETSVDSSSTYNWTAEHQRTTYFSHKYYQVNGTIVICEDYEKSNSKSR